MRKNTGAIRDQMSRDQKNKRSNMTTALDSISDNINLQAKSRLPTRKLQCFSVACADMPHLEFGDKVILPAKVLLELQCFKIPTPLLFQLRPFGRDIDEKEMHLAQYCSVQEFSAPEEHMYVPYWMMQNLHIEEGNEMIVECAVNIPRAIYCRLQPDRMEFLDLAAEIGPKILLETAMRRYSVLSLQETIVIEYAEKKFYVTVLELKPAKVVSLFGDVDLEVDFTPPSTTTNLKRPNIQAKLCTQPASPDIVDSSLAPFTSSALNTPAAVADSIATDTFLPTDAPISFGRRLSDGGYVPLTNDPATNLTKPSLRKLRVSSNALKDAQQNLDKRQEATPRPVSSIGGGCCPEALAKDISKAQQAFKSKGYTLGRQDMQHLTTSTKAEATEINKQKDTPSSTSTDTTTPDPEKKMCSFCLAEVLQTNLELHTLRCSKNIAYHKYKCDVCGEKVLQNQKSEHIHCKECTSFIGSSEALEEHRKEFHEKMMCCCGEKLTFDQLSQHMLDTCPETQQQCALCAFQFKRKFFHEHMKACSSRTELCDVCRKYVKITEFQDHIQQCLGHASMSPELHEEQSAEKSSSTLASPGARSNSCDKECAYCYKRGFIGEEQLHRHVTKDCVIARTFQAPVYVTSPESEIKSVVRGSLRRKSDLGGELTPHEKQKSNTTNQTSTAQPNDTDEIRTVPVTKPFSKVQTKPRVITENKVHRIIDRKNIGTNKKPVPLSTRLEPSVSLSISSANNGIRSHNQATTASSGAPKGTTILRTRPAPAARI